MEPQPRHTTDLRSGSARNWSPGGAGCGASRRLFAVDRRDRARPRWGCLHWLPRRRRDQFGRSPRRSGDRHRRALTTARHHRRRVTAHRDGADPVAVIAHGGPDRGRTGNETSVGAVAPVFAGGSHGPSPDDDPFADAGPLRAPPEGGSPSTPAPVVGTVHPDATARSFADPQQPVPGLLHLTPNSHDLGAPCHDDGCLAIPPARRRGIGCAGSGLPHL